METLEKRQGVLQIHNAFLELNTSLINAGFNIHKLDETALKHSKSTIGCTIYITCAIITAILFIVYEYGLGVRCVIPNNYFVWEATRPVSDCDFCKNVTQPMILYNVTQQHFLRYSYSSKPIVVKNAVLHWPAFKVFNFNYFKNLYNTVQDAYRSVDEECQFLHFKSNFISLRDVFAMSEARVKNLPGQRSWYIGWGNCDPTVLAEMHRYYPKPHFLPEDCEIPAKAYVFMGYDAGATMHLDFINRLMWQAQLKGSKTWHLKPTPECETICSSLTFQVNPGDAVLLDTRVWYHGTTIAPGEFSLAIQSEYG